MAVGVPVYSEASDRPTGPVAFTVESYMAKGGKAKIASVSKRPGIHVTGHRGDTHDGTTSKRCGKAPPLRAAALDGGELLHRSTTRFPVRRGRHRLVTLLLLRKEMVWPRFQPNRPLESRKPLFCNPGASARKASPIWANRNMGGRTDPMALTRERHWLGYTLLTLP